MRVAVRSDGHGHLPALDAVLAEVDRAGPRRDAGRGGPGRGGPDRGRLVVNPGSVGMPYGRSGAHRALLGPGVELRRTTYDLDAACAVLTAGGYPGVESWLDAYVRSTYSDDEVLAVFGPRDGR